MGYKTSRQKALSHVNPAILVSHIPVTKLENGRLTIPVTIKGSRPLNFIIDTGATQSAIYKPTALELQLPIESGSTVRIFGMVKSEVRPEILVPDFQIMHEHIDVLALALLDTPHEDAFVNSTRVDGILGLDVLNDFRLFYDHRQKILHLAPTTDHPPTIPRAWDEVALFSNPYTDDGRNLKFMDIGVLDPNAHALLDLGSEVNMMNWTAARYPKLKVLRRKLKENWRLSGAVGRFTPRLKIRVNRIRLGQKIWKNQEFWVLDFEHLQILGLKDKPFVIAGVALLNETTFVLDFRHNILAIAPETKQAGSEKSLKRQKRIRDDFFGQHESKSHR